MATSDPLGSIDLPSDFVFGAVPSAAERADRPDFTARGLVLPPSLGPLSAFTGTWTGSGFNSIFRPDSPNTPTPLPTPVTGSDNILELNLTEETLTFSKSLGSVPNRGTLQADAFLNGIPYLQAINDVTIANQKVGIHVEPGIWICVPPTTHPAEVQTVARMASIPHGTTIVAQGTSTTTSGAPTIPVVDMTPFALNGGNKIRFPSQTAATTGTARIPQNLTAFIAAGTITQAILDDPNTVLRLHLHGQTITSTTRIDIATAPPNPLFGGGTDNIAFLRGDAAAATPNANASLMTATFWIETVQHILTIPIFTPGHQPLVIAGHGPNGLTKFAPKFLVNPPMPITAPRQITLHSTQIQYSQTVMLDFKGLRWPHVSVATLTPSAAIPIPPSAWA